jgi:hypothetical protein
MMGLKPLHKVNHNKLIFNSFKIISFYCARLLFMCNVPNKKNGF